MFMTNANVIFGKECRENLYGGVNEVVDAISVTYGPNAKNAVLFTDDGVRVTKDGYNTACLIEDGNPYRQIGVQLIQDLCKRTAHDVGDGSSTVAILARAIIEEYKDDPNPIAVARELQKYGEVVEQWIKTHCCKTVTTKEELQNIATVSANNDPVIGKLIADAFEKVGKNGIVTFQETDDLEDSIEYTDGFRIENGYFSPYFINTAHNTCELENVYVYISDTKIEEVKRVAEIAAQALHAKKSLLLMAPDFDSEVLVFLKENLDKIKSCCVLNPNRRNYREIMLSDLRFYLGADSCCDKVTITNNTTIFTGRDAYDESAQNTLIENIKAILDNPKLSEIDRPFHQKRLANFTSGIAVISIGGNSEVEIKEKYDRIEDAVRASQAALTEGYVIGGGKTLQEAALWADISDRFKKILLTPATLLDTLEVEDLESKGVLDPYLVTVTALKNAISTASTLLTADVAIVHRSF